ncbi:hypothetical protein ACLKA6_002736 [Drosophila palustris]
MSIYHYPNLKSYWAKNAFGPIQTCMPRSRFEAIKKYFSLSDESERIKKGEQGFDPLLRTRKLVDCLNQRRIEKESATKEKLLQLPDFRETLAEGLVTLRSKNLPGRPISNRSSQEWTTQSPSSQSGRTTHSPSSQTMQSPLSHRSPQLRLKLGQKSTHPISDLRFDQHEDVDVDDDEDEDENEVEDEELLPFSQAH